MRKAIILVRKANSEAIYDRIHGIVTGHPYEMEHTVFSYFDSKEICGIILETKAEVLTELRRWLRAEFSDSAVWMEMTTSGIYPMID